MAHLDLLNSSRRLDAISASTPLRFFLLLIGSLLLFPVTTSAQEHSVARQWNEVLLQAIRDDLARPTVHARNLFHTSVAMYDIWAVYDETAEPFFLGNTVGGYTFEFDLENLPMPDDIEAAREEAISYAMFRLLNHRFNISPGANKTEAAATQQFVDIGGYDPSNMSTDYLSGSAAALGNYVAEQIIAFGRQDGSSEQINYNNRFYKPVNPPLVTKFSGNPDIVDPNRWQPLTLDLVIDQSGNVIPVNTPPFLSPEWGQVVPFALQEEDLTIYRRDGFDYWVYHDPGPPPLIDLENGARETTDYQWGNALVSVWSSHLDPTDGVMWDISPGSIGNIDLYPDHFTQHPDFYDQLNGGDPSRGHEINPHTGQPYAPQIVPRADYARVLAEFWADGPDSETPPGHWFTILNYVTDHEQFEPRMRGQGEVLDPLEWDVKAYFTLAGAMHDAAVTAWGIKGWYDYLRPISAIRMMADQGQCTDPGRANFAIGGLPLIPGYIELIEAGDPLAGPDGENVGEVKVYAWRGPDYIQNPRTDYAGVGWILAKDWWPYQRPTFVTPPFAGYISGHSTFSRAAAEVMTKLTGDPFFPGGMGEFVAKKNEFLVFEEGPSVDIVLQWATYRDASDQTSLSRIWGGIHPPADDLPGRLIGEEIGLDAFALAESYFSGGSTDIRPVVRPEVAVRVYPNPVRQDQRISIELEQPGTMVQFEVLDLQGRRLQVQRVDAQQLQHGFSLNGQGQLPAGTYLLRITGTTWETTRQIVLQ